MTPQGRSRRRRARTPGSGQRKIRKYGHTAHQPTAKIYSVASGEAGQKPKLLHHRCQEYNVTIHDAALMTSIPGCQDSLIGEHILKV
eukprot:s1633_g5.t1